MSQVVTNTGRAFLLISTSYEKHLIFRTINWCIFKKICNVTNYVQYILNISYITEQIGLVLNKKSFLQREKRTLKHDMN